MKGSKAFLRILAGAAGIILVVLILTITNSLIGNPISAWRANKDIEAYVQKNYDFLDLEIDKAKYNFKFSEYGAKAYSNSNVDIHFSIYWKNGKVHYDTYKSSVLDRFNVIQRMEGEYSAYVKALLSDLEGLENNTSLVMFLKEGEMPDRESLPLGMTFNKDLPFDTNMTLRYDVKDTSIENIAKDIERAFETLKKDGCIFDSYDAYASESGGKGSYVMITGMKAEQIEGGDLEELLQEALVKEGVNGINIFIKESE